MEYSSWYAKKTEVEVAVVGAGSWGVRIEGRGKVGGEARDGRVVVENGWLAVKDGPRLI